jgi:hypothetical protein
MRPITIMAAAIVTAVVLLASISWSQIGSRPSLAPMQTIVEHPGGVNLASDQSWDFTCIALLSAPKTMKAGNTADVETDLLTTADRAKVDALMSAVEQAADAINKGPATTATNVLAGLDPEAADAIRRLMQDTGNRQAATDTLPGSPVMTVHLAGPGFKITPDTPERQVVTSGAPAIWRWTVKATEAGERILTVSYNAEVTVAGERIPRALRTVSRNVHVDVVQAGYLKQIAEGASSVKSIAENVSWLWTTMIFPALMFLYGLRKWFKERNIRAQPVC